MRDHIKTGAFMEANSLSQFIKKSENNQNWGMDIATTHKTKSPKYKSNANFKESVLSVKLQIDEFQDINNNYTSDCKTELKIFSKIINLDFFLSL